MNTCRRNPQLPPHKHKRENGMLKCDGYPPLKAVPMEIKGSVQTKL